MRARKFNPHSFRSSIVESDRRAMQALLAHHSPKLRKALQSGRLGIDTLGGSGNLSYKLTLAREAMCVTHSLMDNDLSGREAVKHAIGQTTLAVADLTYTSCLGMADSEMEDWYDSTVIASVLSATFGVPAASPHFTSTKEKWSDRMRKLFISSGKPWDATVEGQAKWKVAEAVTSAPTTAPLGGSTIGVRCADLEP